LLNKNTDIAHADAFNDAAAADGVSIPIVSEGYSKMCVWWVTDAPAAAISPRVAILGKRPFNLESMGGDDSASEAGPYDTHSTKSDSLWLPCNIDTAENEGLSGVTTTFFFCGVTGVLVQADSTFYNPSAASTDTKVFAGPTVDVSGTLEVTAVCTVAAHADNDGYLLGQFIA
tara:strand:+ start:431 stop:949 length:519 start_codon:yes stop_codon:yes gene_type:complete